MPPVATAQSSGADFHGENAQTDTSSFEMESDEQSMCSRFHPSEGLLTAAARHEIMQIRALWDLRGVHFYQAYSRDIGEFAIRNQTLRGAPGFKTGSRMTWLKPSLGWMLYRCGYGKKHSQECVLRIQLSHEAVGRILDRCLLSSTNKDHDDGSARPDAGEKAGGRVQWDPERSWEDSPSPATLAISTFLKAGESVFQPLLWTRLEGHNHCFMRFCASKHCLEHFSPRL